MAALGAPQSTLTLQVAFASDPDRREHGQPDVGPRVTSARRAIGSLYGLSSEDVDTLEMWHWDDQGHAHDITEDTLQSAMDCSLSCGAQLRLTFVPGSTRGRAVGLEDKSAVVEQPGALRQPPVEVENGPKPSAETVPVVSAENGPKSFTETVPVVSTENGPLPHTENGGPKPSTEGWRPEQVATPPVQGIQGEPEEGKAVVESKDASGVAAAAEAQPGAEAGKAGVGAVAGEQAGSRAAAPGAWASGFHFHRPEAADAPVEQQPLSHEEAELEARQAHRMDVTVFPPEMPHEVKDAEATEAEARASMRMD